MCAPFLYQAEDYSSCYIYSGRTYNALRIGCTIIEEILETELRGQKIKLTTESLNTILGIIDVPIESEKTLIDAEIFAVLKPGEPIGPLTFNPASICDTFRVI